MGERPQGSNSSRIHALGHAHACSEGFVTCKFCNLKVRSVRQLPVLGEWFTPEEDFADFSTNVLPPLGDQGTQGKQYKYPYSARSGLRTCHAATFSDSHV